MSPQLLNIVDPEAGTRYTLHMEKDIPWQSIGSVKHYLAASSCPIPVQRMALKANGVPLHDDTDTCGMFGIRSGATLTVEDTAVVAGSAQPTTRHGYRRQLELKTLEEQEYYLARDRRTSSHALYRTLERMDTDAEVARSRKAQLERQFRHAARAVTDFDSKCMEAERERQRLAAVQAEEEAVARQRAVDLAARRELLKREQEAARAVEKLTLENEKRKALLARQRTALETERERVKQEQRAMESAAKARALAIRAREIEVEQRKIAVAREEREVLAERRIAVQQRLLLYTQLSLDVPHSLLREWEEVQEAVASLNDSTELRRVKHQRYTHSLQQPPSTSPWRQEDNTPSFHAQNGSFPSEPSLRRPPMGSGTAGAGDSPVPETPTTPHSPDSSFLLDPMANAVANLRGLGNDLQLHEPLNFDENLTCVISIDGEYTLLISYDAATKRLCLYSTLLTNTSLHDASLRLQLYEYLLENSLLGRDMCGGGIGTSLRNGFILLSTSFYMPTSHPSALRTAAPQFVMCLKHWRRQVARFLAAHGNPPHKEAEALGCPLESPIASSHKHPSYPPQQQQHAVPPPAVGGRHPVWRSADRGWLRVEDSAAMPPVVPRVCGSGGTSRTAEGAAGGHAQPHPVVGLEVTSGLVLGGVPTQYDDGVLIVDVAGPSREAGLLPHDYLTALGGLPVRSVADFATSVQALRPGQMITVEIVRNGQRLTRSLTVGEATGSVYTEQRENERAREKP